uniref:Uncharacterized protein LOC114327580 n=1 Tax=Diabrotica virgifera virgifera TaxID=50390 RepID=A0A6P7F926_DIAVI
MASALNAIEQVMEMKYLGITLLSYRDLDKEVHGCSGRSPHHYESDGEESNSSSAGSISVAASPHVQMPSQIPGTTSLSDWYVCQPTPAPPDPLGSLGHFGNLHHSGATAAY